MWKTGHEGPVCFDCLCCSIEIMNKNIFYFLLVVMASFLSLQEVVAQEHKLVLKSNLGLLCNYHSEPWCRIFCGAHLMEVNLM